MIKWELRSESRRDMNKSYHSGVGLPKYRNIFFKFYDFGFWCFPVGD